MREFNSRQLLEKYRNGTCSSDEKAIVEYYYLNNDLDSKKLTVSELETSANRVIDRSNKILINESQVRRMLRNWSIAAASVFILISIGTLMFVNHTPKTKEYVTDIQPGTNKATLTLANGKKINLNDEKTGIVVDVDELIYDDGSAVDDTKEMTGTQSLTTPKGGQYQIAFKDGTKIWLNAASTLTFQISRSKLSTRDVYLTGEAYFEIAKDKKRPFRVHSNDQVVEVLGTHFNINSYPGESFTKTTLLEGSVEVNGKLILAPGEQSLNQNGQLTKKEVDLDLETAWKNGKIQFEDADLKTVMDILARWYDIMPDYQYYPAQSRFTGSISRHKNISEVLKLLESTNEVHFKIEGRRVTTIK